MGLIARTAKGKEAWGTMPQRLPLTAQAVEAIGAAVAQARRERVSGALLGLLVEAQEAAIDADFGRKIGANFLNHAEITTQTRREMREMARRLDTPPDPASTGPGGHFAAGGYDECTGTDGTDQP
jgi:hypothetical protein